MVDSTVEESIGIITEMTVYDRQNSRGNYRNNYKNDSYNRSRNRPRQRSFPEIIATVLEIEVQATVGPGQDPEQVLIGIEFDVISVGNMIISQGTAPLLVKKQK